MYSKKLADYLRNEVGASSHDKRIPKFIKNMNQQNLQILHNTMMEGDGSKTKGYTRYYTVSRRLAEDFAEISIKLGYSATIKSRETWNPSKTRKNKSFYVSLRQKQSTGCVESRNKFISEYSGKIWCVRTPSGNFFVERNGTISCSGNTMNVMGERQHPEKFIPMCVRKIRDGEKIYIHSNKEKTQAGSRFYIHAQDVAEAIYFLLHLNKNQKEYMNEHMKKLGVRCPKFNIVGKEEVDNLTMVKILAEAQKKDPVYEMVDFHTSRPGHDLRYSLDGKLMKTLGWYPTIPLRERLFELTNWSLNHKEWIEL